MFSAKNIAAFALLMTALSGMADTITVDGETYNDVIVTQGYAVYYVQFPETGERVPIDKARVAADAVTYTDDAKRRGELIHQYRAKRIEQRIAELKADEETRRRQVKERIAEREKALEEKENQLQEMMKARGYPEAPEEIQATNPHAPGRAVAFSPAPNRTVLQSPGPQPKKAPTPKPAAAKPAAAPQPAAQPANTPKREPEPAPPDGQKPDAAGPQAAQGEGEKPASPVDRLRKRREEMRNNRQQR